MILASSTDLKELKLQTVYSQMSEHIKPSQLVGQGSQATELQFESKFKPQQVIWQSLPKAIPEDNRRFDCKINGRALGAALSSIQGTALVGLTGKHKHRAFPIRLQSLLAAKKRASAQILIKQHIDFRWTIVFFFSTIVTLFSTPPKT